MKKPLFLYEEVMLLALRDEEGTIASGSVEYAVAGAVLAELFLDGHLHLAGRRGDLIDQENPPPTGDPVVDECLEKIKTAKRRASVPNWISRLSKIPKLREKVARRLCERGIVKADEDKILLLFPRTIYPEINPEPEKEIIKRLEDAIFGKKKPVAPKTVTLISLAHATNLLEPNLGKKEVRAKKKRIEEIVEGETIGAAAREAIEAGDAIAMIAALVPALMAGSASS